MEFASNRLLFKDFTTSDYPLFASVFSNEQVMQYAYRSRISDEDEMRAYFDTVLKNACSAKRTSYELAVFSGTQFIGFADFHIQCFTPEHKTAEAGYFLLPNFWGFGFTTEIVERFLQLLFGDMGLHKVYATCNACNKASERVMIKNGMTKEYVLRQERFKDGRWDDELRYGVLREEWEQKNNGQIAFSACPPD